MRGMKGPHLKLTVEKGPLEGRTLEKRSGLKIRIGRTVRGNQLVISDNGISSHHVFFAFNGENWVVIDRNSLNGTFLNGVKLIPKTPIHLSDGDLIKIGDSTSIRVSLKVVDLRSKVVSKSPLKPATTGKRPRSQQQQFTESSLVSDDKKQNFRGKSKKEDVTTSVAENQGWRGRTRRGAAALSFKG